MKKLLVPFIVLLMLFCISIPVMADAEETEFYEESFEPDDSFSLFETTTVYTGETTTITLYLTANYELSLYIEDPSIISAYISGKGVIITNGNIYYSRDITVYGMKNGSTTLQALVGSVTAWTGDIYVEPEPISLTGAFCKQETIEVQSYLDETFSSDNEDVIVSVSSHNTVTHTTQITVGSYTETFSIQIHTYSIDLTFNGPGDFYFNIIGSGSGELKEVQAEIYDHSLIHLDERAPDCIDNGYIEHWKCDQCGACYNNESRDIRLYPEDITIPALGHDYIYHEGKAATCLAAGWNDYETCSRCDYSTYTLLPITDHTREIMPAIEPTCTENGLSEGEKCSVCGRIFRSQYIIYSRGHEYEDGACIKCGITFTGWVYPLDGVIIYNPHSLYVTGTDPTLAGKDVFYYVNGIKTTGWMEYNGTWYLFDNNGAMLTGWQIINGKRYYLDKDWGGMATDWREIDGRMYFFKQSGAQATGWQKYWWNENWYYYNSSGEIAIGWQKINGTWYYFKSNGAMAADEWCDGYYLNANGSWTRKDRGAWQKLSNGKWCYKYGGVVATGWQKIDGEQYYMNNSGEMQTGWQKINYDWYYFKNSGAMQTGWLKSNGKWYYFYENGLMAWGWQYVDGIYYYFNMPSGEMLTGWQKIDGYWYYFKSSGESSIGWQKINGTWYYFKEDHIYGDDYIPGIGGSISAFMGAMAANEWCGGYWLNKDGSWTYQPIGSWHQNSKGWWFGDTSGWYAKNTTIKIDGKNYTFNASGYWVK